MQSVFRVIPANLNIFYCSFVKKKTTSKGGLFRSVKDYAFLADLSFQETHSSGARQMEENKPAIIPIIMG